MKLSIRDLLWLTVVVALAAGWGVDGLRQRNTVSGLAAALAESDSQREATQDKLDRLVILLGNRGERVTFSGSTITIYSGNGATVHGSSGWPE